MLEQYITHSESGKFIIQHQRLIGQDISKGQLKIAPMMIKGLSLISYNKDLGEIIVEYDTEKTNQAKLLDKAVPLLGQYFTPKQ